MSIVRPRKRPEFSFPFFSLHSHSGTHKPLSAFISLMKSTPSVGHPVYSLWHQPPQLEGLCSASSEGNTCVDKIAAPSNSIAFLNIIPQTHKMQQRAIDYAYGVIFSPATGGLFWTTWNASPQSDVLILEIQVSPSDIPPHLASFHFLLTEPKNKYFHGPFSQKCGKSPWWQISKRQPSLLAAVQQISKWQEQPPSCCNYWNLAETQNHI